ncbi:MAG: hypothetical protein Phog2KO_07830 [Phototrophicaceae bacterium]
MKIAIIGAGFVGESLARAVTKFGYEVMLSSRNPNSDKMQTLIHDIGSNVQAGTVEDTLAFSDIVAIALQYDDALEVVQTGDWSDKIVLDMTQGDMQKLQDLTGASVVKIFNSIGAEHYQNPVFAGINATMFYCGDDKTAKETVAKIAATINFSAIDAGDSSMGQHLVNLAQFWVALMQNGMGRDFAFKLIQK